MENRIYKVTYEEMKKVEEKFKTDSSLFVAEFNGKTINKLEDYFDEIKVKMKFPQEPYITWDGYSDWMTDLMWLNADEYILIIKHFSMFMQKDIKNKEKFIKNLESVILPWWQTDVEKYCVGGKAKPFNVYLVD